MVPEKETLPCGAGPCGSAKLIRWNVNARALRLLPAGKKTLVVVGKPREVDQANNIEYRFDSEWHDF